MFEVSTELLILLLGVAFAAGFFDAIAGGGGLITVPVLLLCGANPVTALATNKVQALFGAGSAALTYAKGGHVDLKSQIGPAILAFFGAVIGAMLITIVPTDFIRLLLPVLLIAIALYFGLSKGLNDQDRTRRMSPMVFTATMVPLVGFYDGLLGPGTGSFFMLAFVGLAGYGVLKATAHTKLLNFASNVGATIAFAFVATPWWATGIAMGFMQILGARLGAKLAQRIGARLIKPLLVTTSLALALKLLWDMV